MSKVSSALRPCWNDIAQGEFRNLYRELTSLHDLAAFWGVAPYQLSYYAFHADKRKVYRPFEIPRRYGGKRLIEAPTKTLKYIQRLLHESLTQIYGPHPAVHGFLPGRSVITNAERHLQSRYVLNVDLQDFFWSITRRRVYGRLTAEPYSLNGKVANVIASLSTNSYLRLPQGSPSSPVIANMVAAELDTELVNLSRSFGCWYTRYADDITISTPRGELSPELARYPHSFGTGQVVIGDKLTDAIERHGFRINHRKSRLQSYWTRQVCTGLVVNGCRVSPPRPYVRRLRSLVHHWRMDGWREASQVLHSTENRPLFGNRQRFKDHVIGRIGYLKMVRGQDDPIARRLSEVVESLPPNH